MRYEARRHPSTVLPNPIYRIRLVLCANNDFELFNCLTVLSATGDEDKEHNNKLCDKHFPTTESSYICSRIGC